MVVVRGLSHEFGSRSVLKDINLTVEKGEIVAIMGSSGGGKTTLLRCLSGLIRPTKGEVNVGGVDVGSDPEAARRLMGMVFQSAALFDSMTVRENVLFGPRRRGLRSRREEDALVEEALSQVGLTDAQGLYPSELSGGMRKRVGIARALALKPQIMLYDEPTTGLDPITTYSIDHLMVDLRASTGMTSIIVSHDVSGVFRTADRVAFLEDGEITFLGKADAFRASSRAAIKELVAKATATSFG